MQHAFDRSIAILLLVALHCSALGAERPARPTHILQPVLLEVSPARTNGNPWDTGIGAYARPDPQVTLMRHDAAALKVTVALLIQAMERNFKDKGNPVPAQFRDLIEKSAMLSLRCGKNIEALEDQQLNAARAKFAADTSVASDSHLNKIADGGLRVGLGDQVMIFVNDIDLASHDAIGQAELAITKELLKKGEAELKFNSVELLRFKLAPID